MICYQCFNCLQDEEQVDYIIRFLASYVTKHLIPFVRSHGGWVNIAISINAVVLQPFFNTFSGLLQENLVEHYPIPVDDDSQMKRAILWSGLCVGLMATMYVSSFLSSR